MSRHVVELTIRPLGDDALLDAHDGHLWSEGRWPDVRAI